MELIQGIQFIGTQRSGSNLLRVMLNQKEQIVAPHPPHILLNFKKILSSYGTLDRPRNFERLVEDSIAWVENNPVRWENTVLDRDALINECNNPSLMEVFRVIYNAAARAENANFWCCKSMANVHFAKEFEATSMAPFYIYLFRDGRDVALSFQKAIVGEKHIYHLAQKWKKDQEACIALREKVPADRFIQVRYEDLIEDPEKEIRSICESLKIPFQESYKDYHKSSESKNTSASGEMWQNVKKPVLKTNFNKFKKEMKQEDLLVFESVAGNVLTELGYELQHTPEEQIQSFSEDELVAFDQINTELKKEAQKSADPNDILKRKWQSDFISKAEASLSQGQF